MNQEGILQNIIDNYLISANYLKAVFYNNIQEIWVYFPPVDSFYGADSNRGSCRRKILNFPRFYHLPDKVWPH